MKNSLIFLIIIIALAACATSQVKLSGTAPTQTIVMIPTDLFVMQDNNSDHTIAGKPTLVPGATLDPTLTNASGGYMLPGSSEPIEDWWGVIKSTEPGAQYDDYFERQDLGGAILFGINSLDPEIESKIEALRDSGRVVHISGTLLSNVSDYNGSQVQVDCVEVQE